MPYEYDANLPEYERLFKDGLTYRQIGERFGLTREQIKKRLDRWRKVPTVRQVPSSMPVVEVLDPHIIQEDWVDRLYANAKEQARIRQEATKPVSVFNVKISEDKPIMFVWVGDVHLLDAGTDHYLWDEDRATWYETDGVYLGCGGDWANWFSPAVLPKAMPANVLPSDYAAKVVRRHLTILQERKKVLFGCVGNHDEFPAAAGWHPIQEIYRSLDIPDLGSGGRVFLHVGDVKYQIDARHSFNFNSNLNDTNAMRQLWAQAGKPDMVALAHLHHPTLHHRTFDGEDTVWFRNGSYKRNDQFAKSKNYVHTQSEPADMPGIILSPDHKRMVPFRNYRDGLSLLKVLRG